jgi:hypothetical protein
MYNRIIKNKFGPDYHSWLKTNQFSVLSPKHRGIYAEMIFKKYCLKYNILAIKINSFFPIDEQISMNFLTKKQQKELGDTQLIPLHFFCIENNKKIFLTEIKMGTSNLSLRQKTVVEKLKKIEVYLFRVFEDAEIFIKKIN